MLSNSATVRATKGVLQYVRGGSPEGDTPQLWLAGIDHHDGVTSDIYVINDSGEPLHELYASRGAFITIDDEAHGGGPEPTFCETLEPGEAV
ncbi:MAG: hypothetical protein U5L11_00905 [Arhodomonas sp.]|nr:hypothetical protein [Arhodomonas sp.]